MEHNLFIVAGEILSTGVSIEEIETMVNDKLDEFTGGLGRFTINELSNEKVIMNFWRDFILQPETTLMYDMDMSLITGIDLSCFQLRPIGDPMIYPLKMDARTARFYTDTKAFLRFYKNLLAVIPHQRVRDLKIRIYKDRIRFQIEF